ncbi:hypothetical protein GN958_ATG21369 [Phytophthora infestans]|uniref:Uncharacterized protein n=1 Tax=Phytophthora infestans TaxID=4787 RepID=A0A8S9TS97_PHYIN|nr:hypothetical protein GN958_ATG21369 [Phytophthora infestans]
MMRRSAQDVAMNGESKHEEEDEMGDVVPSIPAGFSTPRRRQKKNNGGFEFSVTPEPSRRRLSTSRGRQSAVGLEESPARYSPSKVKAAVRSFADFLHFLEQEEHQQEHALMPVIIQRFAELGAVIESQKRHIDRWKGKELDLAIEEAQQNLELIRELGETIQKQELQIAEFTVEKQKWEEKYHLAAQEIETLKTQGTYQIQQLRSEVSMLRQAGVEVEKKLKDRDTSLATLKKSNDSLLSQLEQMQRDSSTVMQENTTLKQQTTHQSEGMRVLEQQIQELREHYEAVGNKASELEQDVAAWQKKFKEKSHQVSELENALNNGRQEMGQREGNFKELLAKNRKLQEHVDRMAQEHEKQLAEQHKYRGEVEAERQRLTQVLQQESTRFQNLRKEAGEARAQIEAQAMAAMKQREQQLLDEKARVEEELQLQFSKINEENIELRATVDNLKDINRRKSTEIGRLMATSQEAEQQIQSRMQEAQKMQQLTEEVARAKQQMETLSKTLAAKESAHDEAMKLQSAEFENQYNDFVSQVEGQFNEMTQENEQLRSDIEEAAKKLTMYEGQVTVGGEELNKWRSECEKLQHQLHEGARENESLKRELEHRLQELEQRHKENAELNARIEQFLSPDNERTREVELLQGERLRLEARNQELQRLMEETRADAEATMEEAHRVHDRSIEDNISHENTVRLLCEEKEALNRNLMTLSSEKSTVEAQIATTRNEIEHWKASVHQLESDKRGLELRLQEVMRQATDQIETQKHSAAMATEDGRTQLQKLTAQLVQRDAQMTEGHQQLRRMQEMVRSLEEKLRTQQYESESLQMKNDQLNGQLDALRNEKRGLEHVMRRHTSTLRDGLEEDLSQRLERLARDMERRVQEESEKTAQLQSVLDSKLDSQLQHSSEERTKLEQENARLQRELEMYAAELEKMDAELLQLQREREEQERLLSDLQQTIATYEEDQRTRNNANDDFIRLDAVHSELKTTHEQFKQDLVAQLREKEKEVAELQDEMTELQSKLDQEKEMTRHLMDRSHADKQQHAKELSEAEEKQLNRAKEMEASMKELQHKLRANEQAAVDREHMRVKELEASVKRLERELQVSQQSMTGKEQSAMHEKLQREREHRALQTRYDTLDAENAANVHKMDTKVEEIEHLHGEIDQLHEEIERLNEEVRDNTAEMDNARNHLHVSEQLTMKLEELQDELAAREDEARRRDADLAAKEEKLQLARDVEEELKRQLRDNVRRNEDEAASLKQQNAKLREQLKRAAQAKLSAEDDAARETAMKNLEKAYDDSVQREQELTSQLAQLEDSKTSLLNQFRREMRKLNVEFGAQASKAEGIDDGAFLRGIMGVSALLRSYQDRETRQDALMRRKEKQINELKTRLDEVERSFRLRDDEKKRDELRAKEESLYHQVETMSEEVSKLKLENQELRENPSSPEDVCEWEEKCAKLKNHVHELKEANTTLKEKHFSKADMKALVKEVEKLTNEVLEKDSQLQALRNRETSRPANGSRGSRALLEEKVMVLNDHLTGLMTENMQLQHSVEQYAIQYGPLDGTPNGVIGNSGIRVPTRANGKPAVRSQ